MAAIYPWALAFVDGDFPGTEASPSLQKEVSKVLPTGCGETVHEPPCPPRRVLRRFRRSINPFGILPCPWSFEQQSDPAPSLAECMRPGGVRASAFYAGGNTQGFPRRFGSTSRTSLPTRSGAAGPRIISKRTLRTLLTFNFFFFCRQGVQQESTR